jgi:predicted DNA-binding transcriptional regulator YafY
MTTAQRLFEITQLLQSGQLLRASDIAKRLGVSQRTVYRDMDRLVAAGQPVEGTRGEGYRLAATVPLPPLTLTPEELEALTLGLAVVGQAGDTALQAAAASLSAKIDDASGTGPDPWGFATSPFADATRNLAHLPLLRSTTRARQKVRITYTSDEGQVTARVIRPLKLAYWGHVWAVTAWCELRAGFRVFRLDLMDSAEALPELFADEPGKRLEDFSP